MSWSKIFILLLSSFSMTAASQAEVKKSIFAQLASNSEKSAIQKILKGQKIDLFEGATVGEGNRTVGGQERSNVSGTEIAAKLEACTVDRWSDIGSSEGSAFVLWNCPTKRLAANDCYFLSYRAAMRAGSDSPALLFVELPSWDFPKCGRLFVAPPKAPWSN